MTKDIAVSQRAREAAADLIDQYWSGSDDAMRKLAASIRAGHRHGAFVRAFARFEAEIRAEVWERAEETVKSIPLESFATLIHRGQAESNRAQILDAIRNQKDHEHE